MIGGEEEPAGCGLSWQGVRWARRAGAQVGGVGLTATHSAARVGGGHDRGIRGPGLLSQIFERGP